MSGRITPADLRGFTGTDEWYRHALVRGVTYTEGVKFLAEQAGAYWLLDKVATLQLEKRVAAEPRQFWTLEQVGDHPAAVLTCTDGDKGDGPVLLHSERIDFTDFPFATLGTLKLYCFDRVILLPSEY